MPPDDLGDLLATDPSRAAGTDPILTISGRKLTEIKVMAPRAGLEGNLRPVTSFASEADGDFDPRGGSSST